MHLKNGPIGIFDSGVGGLSVLRVLADAFPNEDFIYLGDTARLPYGTKSLSTIRNYVEQNVRFLVTQGVRMVVIACHSASATALEEREFEGIPLFNVIEPAIKTALQISEHQCIGLIATNTTVNSKSYDTLLHKLAPQTNLYMQAAPLLVSLVEEGWIDDPHVEPGIISHRLEHEQCGRVDRVCENHDAGHS